jgi:FHS family L-fucose permease-like MFS transporter
MANNTQQRSLASSLFLVGCLFFIFGFVTWLNGTLIPFLKTACELNDAQAYLVTSATFISYLFMAIPSSAILRKTGFKNGMSLGLLIMAVGTLVFIPAAHQRNYPLFLTGLFIQGLGITILQTAVNPYVTILGPQESAARRISFMGAAHKLAGITIPLIISGALLNNIDGINKQLHENTDVAARTQLLNELALRIINPYIILTVIIVIAAILVKLSPLPEMHEETANPDTDDATTSTTSIFHHPYLFLGAITIFVYVGAEVIAGDTIINYGKYWNIPMDNAKFFTSITLTCMLAGYFLGIVLMPKVISQENALKFCALLGVTLSIAVMLTTGMTSVILVASLGFANAIMWPAIWPLSLKGLGKFTKLGSAILIMGVVGGGILPPLYGRLSDAMHNNRAAYIILIPCYLYILFFAVKGNRIGYKELAKV